MNALSLLASTAQRIEPVGYRDGYIFDEKSGKDEYHPIPYGQKLVCEKEPDDAMIEQLAPMLRPTTIENIREHIARLALLKKIGQTSEATMPMLLSSMAFELAEFSEIAILVAFRQIKLNKSPWMPTIGEIVEIVLKSQDVLDKWVNIYRSKKAALTALESKLDA